MSNYYEVLGLNVEASESDIKKAYKKLLRQYPPENNPEEFKKIRRAYETLSNNKEKLSYDAVLKYKDEIDKYSKTGNEALDQEDYQTAIKSFKKILLIEPSLTFARNLLGIALHWNGDIDKAIDQFRQCIRENPENATYHYNLAIAFRDSTLYAEAEKSLREAHKLNPIGHDIIDSLASLLFYDIGNYEGAVATLRKAINYSNKVDFENFIYFFKLVEINIVARRHSELPSLIKEIEKIVPSDQDTRDYVAYKFATLSKELYDYKMYDLSNEVARLAKKFAPDDEYINELIKYSDEWGKAYEQFDRLSKDERITPQIKGPIHYFMLMDEYEKEKSEDEINNMIDENFDAISSYINNDFDTVIKSISVLKNEYRILYNYKKELYQEVEKLARENKDVDSAWKRLNNDHMVRNCFKRLVALWISKDLTDRERDTYYQDIMNELSHEPVNELLNSLNRLKTNYLMLYNLNSDFLNKMRTELTQSQSQSQSQNYNSSKTRTTSSYTPPASNSSSCFVATAAFGTPWADEIILLRRWRDTSLKNNYFGVLFIKFYYKFGRYAAKLVEKSSTLKAGTRWVIYQIIKLLKHKNIV